MNTGAALASGACLSSVVHIGIKVGNWESDRVPESYETQLKEFHSGLRGLGMRYGKKVAFN